MNDETDHPSPTTEDELVAFIRSQVGFEHDHGEDGYQQSADALWKCALAAFNYAADKVGATGFQAGWAELQFLRASRRLKGPFALIDGEQLLYPQYETPSEKGARFEREWAPELARMAREKIAAYEDGTGGHPHPDVWDRWQQLAAAHTEEDTTP